ncbi:MAG: hypothetical protein JST85_24065 [Acidobacteria bacterium]|nr:hypothetical protein [Acidobacteriota bacterium]
MQLVDRESNSVTVGVAALKLLRHPVENLIRRWNWKSAMLSALTRGALFFFANLGAGISAAVGAMSVEAAFYITVAGFYGSATEAFRRARPTWLATVVMMVVMPSINHLLEFALHWSHGTKKLTTGIIASVAFSMLSAVFNLFAMQRGAFIVGAERQSLLDDFRQLPRIIFDFLTVVPRAVWVRARQD